MRRNRRILIVFMGEESIFADFLCLSSYKKTSLRAGRREVFLQRQIFNFWGVWPLLLSMLRSSRRTFSLPWGRDGLQSLSCPLGWTLSLLYLSASIEMMWFGSIAFIGFISTWWCQKQETRDAGCFSALLRAHSISTYQIKSFERDNYLFQCPTSGSSHFYYLLPFHLTWRAVRFNALHRAHPISTLQKFICFYQL